MDEIIGLFSLSHEQNKAPFYGTFSRHDITRTSSVLLIWLNENVRFNYAVARKQRRSQFKRNLNGYFGVARAQEIFGGNL